jgi:serine protease Do
VIKLKHSALALTVTLFATGALGLGACAQKAPHVAAEDFSTVELVERCAPSVVAVHFSLDNDNAFAAHEEQEGGGSGFVVDDEGRIVTNFHLVAPALSDSSGADFTLDLAPQATLSVSFVDQPEKRFPARVLGANPDFDLALLEVLDAAEMPKVRPLPLGDSDRVSAGEKAVAIGSPFGLHATVTSGIVSAIKRGRPGLVGIEIPFIQTDAAINPGNSGGPLFNARGEVIGINNAILASPVGPQAFIGVGFAVPVNLLKQSMGDLLAGGYSGVAAAVASLPSRARLGLSGAFHVDDYPDPLRHELGFPDHGVVILEVSPGGPAEDAGLVGPVSAVTFGGHPFPAGGDIIIAANGTQVRRFIELQRIVLEHEAGDVITLTVWRDGQERDVEVVLQVVAGNEQQASAD